MVIECYRCINIINRTVEHAPLHSKSSKHSHLVTSELNGRTTPCISMYLSHETDWAWQSSICVKGPFNQLVEGTCCRKPLYFDHSQWETPVHVPLIQFSESMLFLRNKANTISFIYRGYIYIYTYHIYLYVYIYIYIFWVFIYHVIYQTNSLNAAGSPNVFFLGKIPQRSLARHVEAPV